MYKRCNREKHGWVVFSTIKYIMGSYNQTANVFCKGWIVSTRLNRHLGNLIFKLLYLNFSSINS